jgi:hypothetical protein
LAEPTDGEPLFPGSLCHACAAPPRLIRTPKAAYIFCPIFKRYPPQPVRECERFVRRAEAGNPPAGRKP